MRRIIVSLLAALAAIVALGSVAVATGSDSPVTRARLERALPAAFAQRYAAQAELLGHSGVTAASLHPRAMCDKHGPDVPDIGPGGDWVCLMGWTDPNMPMPPEGYGKFELNVHASGCATVTGPTKLTGYLTLTDTKGRDVDNPAFEFDMCFDPHADDTPTGVMFESVLSVVNTAVRLGAERAASLDLTCGPGAHGCAGTVVVSSGGLELAAVPYEQKETATATVRVPTPVPAGATTLTLTFRPTSGFAPSGPVTLPVQ